MTALLVSTFGMFSTDRLERKMNRMIEPYQGAIAFIDNVDPSRAVNDHDIFIFFNRNGLYKKKDIKKLHTTIRIMKSLLRAKKIAPDVKNKITVQLCNLIKITEFVKLYASTYAALITYYEISAYYYYIDEQHGSVIDLLMEQSEKLGLPTMKKRGLYAFVKKINLDLRRLQALFTQEIISDDLVIKMNQVKRKLLVLKNKIIISAEYKAQHTKTRWLKAVGVLLPLILSTSLFIVGLLPIWSSQVVAYKIFPDYFLGEFLCYPFVGLGISIHELKEASKYNIPVHSTSLFSWFRPFFWPFTWVARG